MQSTLSFALNYRLIFNQTLLQTIQYIHLEWLISIQVLTAGFLWNYYKLLLSRQSRCQFYKDCNLVFTIKEIETEN